METKIKDLFEFYNLNLKDLEGKAFIVIRNNEIIKGLISISPEEDKFFLCSNSNELDGLYTSFKYGFNFSWIVSLNDSNESHDFQGFSILSTVPHELEENLRHKRDIMLQLNEGYTAVIKPQNNCIEVGCQKIPFHKIVELYNMLPNSAKQ